MLKLMLTTGEYNLWQEIIGEGLFVLEHNDSREVVFRGEEAAARAEFERVTVAAAMARFGK